MPLPLTLMTMVMTLGDDFAFGLGKVHLREVVGNCVQPKPIQGL